ncbi:hypothetical protein [Virgibacillus salinus]|uniref:Uncharacterized protein n=1 Tax=Virgibacillus salinus TaxID=553311 RepID=A0A1H0XX68_9BACI|nr:hypothetical protein [Virgibacillus salinus]SDQ07473.1 hypothetical protein SAMN05216231_0275 [Virgibacillus salinus]
MKKFITVLCLFFALSIFLVACGSGEEKSNSEADTQEDVNVSTTDETDEAENKQDEDAAQEEDQSALPEGVPADLPFPAEADLQVQSYDTAGHKQYVVGFSFSEEIDEVYKKFKEYADSNGYNIITEDNENYGFESMKESDAGPTTLGVTFSDMGSVKTGTVSFAIPLE